MRQTNLGLPVKEPEMSHSKKWTQANSQFLVGLSQNLNKKICFQQVGREKPRPCDGVIRAVSRTISDSANRVLAPEVGRLPSAQSGRALGQ